MKPDEIKERVRRRITQQYVEERELLAWEAGCRHALEAIIPVMDETRKKVKESVRLLDVRLAVDSFADQFIAFVKIKLAENAELEKGNVGQQRH